MIDIQTYQQWFDHYTDQFLYHDKEKDYPFVLKKNHTYGVCETSRAICDDIGASQEMHDIAQLIALFHDLGRFEQYARYGTFRDSESVNHAVQSIRDLARHRVLRDLSLKYRRFICNAIRYHNVAYIPSDQKDDDTLFYMRLIRDADKLDIWHVFINYFTNRHSYQSDIIELNLPDRPEVSEAIVQALLNEKIAFISDMKTLNDLRLIQLGWIFDLNFRFSIEYAKKNHIIEQLTENMPETVEIKNLIQKLFDYCDRKLQ